MQKVTYTNSRGESIVFSHRPPFVLSKIEGLGDVDADVQTQKTPYQDGETHIDTLLEPRYINMEISIVGKDIEEYRRQLSKIMNPKFNGILKCEDGSIIREIACINEHVPNYPSKGQSFHLAIVDLQCPNPYWKSESITEEPTFEPLFEFPFEGVFEMGMQRDQRIINNDGDAPAPIQIEFYGPALKPKIINNTTGEFIKINQMLNDGERMLIDTTDGNKSVCFVDENGVERNVFNWIDLNSTFFNLVIGENEIEYTADSDIQGAVVNISYNKLYTAV